ncbi:10659_t:CDS:2 [Diversispora eburnea]|uniref:10659_t:CDS:1 n=1 Tax=Diversispora eburnea TaxID=1213867 RepID=A0A9N9ANJ2_9GLOM|nr:10659_t:CDS:2 [Diversispora eburnea]
MTTEKVPETSSTSKNDAEVFQLEALSTIYQKSLMLRAGVYDEVKRHLLDITLANFIDDSGGQFLKFR